MRVFPITLSGKQYRVVQHEDGTFEMPAELAAFKGHNVALKPAFEPIVVARKPLVGTVAANVLEWGTGALNIDGCRVGTGEGIASAGGTRRSGGIMGASESLGGWEPTPGQGRWPANVLLDGSQAEALDEQSGTTRSASVGHPRRSALGIMNDDGWEHTPSPKPEYGDSGGASRFFPTFRYQAKAPTRERPSYVKDGAGTGRVTGLGGKVRQCNVCETRAIESGASEPSCGHGDFRWEQPTSDTASKVAHPTVKPLALMQWLVRLVTPPGGVVLEPFAGSGTTVEAALLEGFRCIAIEREADYLPLILARLERNRQAAADLVEGDVALFEEPAKPAGRWPTNVVMDRSQATLLDEQSGILKSGQLLPGHKRGQGKHTTEGGYVGGGTVAKSYGGDSGGASRFFPVFEDALTLFDEEPPA